jgi:flavin reductase (DIM6/NTAB) family NADH-FMN oxidoreductase RutF
MRIRIVTFGLNIPTEAYTAHAVHIAPEFTAWPGLLGKWWLCDTACAEGRHRAGVRRPRRADRDHRTDVAAGVGAPGGAVSPGTVLGPVVAVDDLRRVFLDLPQPVAVVTGLSPSGEPVGMTVSSLTSVSLASPLVLFCPTVTSRAWAAARERGSFAVNILGHRQGELAVRFAGPGDRFAGLRTVPTVDRVPMLADALTVLVCDLHDEHPAGDHTVVLGLVRAVHPLCDGTGLDTITLRVRGTTRVQEGRTPRRRRPREASSRSTLRHTKDEAGGASDDCLLRAHGLAGALDEGLAFDSPGISTREAAMAEKEPMVVYAAAYGSVDAALADLDAVEQLHKDEMIGKYDAAVIDQEDGKPHVVKRMDRPHIRVIPEWFGGGTLPRKDLHDAAEQLTADQAGLIVIGEPTIEKGLDKALTKAAKVVKRTVDATTDEITSELQEALKAE